MLFRYLACLIVCGECSTGYTAPIGWLNVFVPTIVAIVSYLARLSVRFIPRDPL